MVDFLTLPEVAEKIHVSKRWLQEFLRGEPIGRKAGRQRLFTEADVIEIYRRLPPCHTSSNRPVKAKRRIGGSVGATSVCALTVLRERLTKGSLKKSCEKKSAELRTTSNVVALPNPSAPASMRPL
jgi:hypothetical protein